MEIAKQIVRLKGKPTIDVEKRHITDDNREMLKQDLEGENIAIVRYKARIEQAKSLEEFGLMEQLVEILEQENEHAADLIMALGNK